MAVRKSCREAFADPALKGCVLKRRKCYLGKRGRVMAVAGPPENVLERAQREKPSMELSFCEVVDERVVYLCRAR